MNFELTLVSRGGAERKATFLQWEGGKDGAGKTMFLVRFHGRTGLKDVVSVCGSHGWCKKPCDDWRLDEESHQAVIDFALGDGRKIAKAPRPTGRKRKPRKGPKPHPRQQDLF